MELWGGASRAIVFAGATELSLDKAARVNAVVTGHERAISGTISSSIALSSISPAISFNALAHFCRSSGVARLKASHSMDAVVPEIEIDHAHYDAFWCGLLCFRRYCSIGTMLGDLNHR